MGYYEEKKSELEDLLALIESGKESLRAERSEFDLAHNRLEERKREVASLENAIAVLAQERQRGFPWLAKAYQDLFTLYDQEYVASLRNKKYPAMRASEIIREQISLRRESERQRRIAEHLVAFYESIAPFLLELKEDFSVDEGEAQRELLKEYSEEELKDEVTNYLTKEEYRKLTSKERNQLALDRFLKRPKSKWLIGRLYERYLGYIYEEDGYDVNYHGIFEGLADLGRDLICRKGDCIVVIQCKNWSKFRTIYEKHIFQFFGTVFQFRDANQGKSVFGRFYTTTELSDLARRFSKELGIELFENFKFEKSYPCVKCNVARQSGEKIYHLPFDQQYDKVKIEKQRGEYYCSSAIEAEERGFRRAKKFILPKDSPLSPA